MPRPTSSNVDVNELREYLHEGRRASCLNELSDEQLLDVLGMLRNKSKRLNYSKMARMILNEWGALAGYKDTWIAVQLKVFGEKALGARRGMRRKHEADKAQSRFESIRLTKKRLDSHERETRKKEEKVRKQLSEMLALGIEIERIQEEIEYWMAVGRERNEPYDTYIPKLLSSLTDMAKQRHSMKIDYGLVKKIAPAPEMSLQWLSMVFQGGQIENPQQLAGALGKFKQGLESIAEPAQIEMTTNNTENDDATELFDENSIEDEGDGVFDVTDYGVGPISAEQGDS